MITQNKLLLAKIESPYGTEPTPTTGSNFIAVHNIRVTPQMTYNESLATDISLSPRAGTLGSKYIEVSFDHQLQMATDTPPIDPLLLSCGYTDTSTNGVYLPRTTGFQSCTLWVYEEDIVWKVNGCRGNVVFNYNAGQPVTLSFTMQGRYAKPTDTTFPITCTDNGGKPCVAMNRAFAFNSIAAPTESLSFSLNNTLAQQPNMDDAVAQGIQEIVITNRDPSGSFNPKLVKASDTPDYWTDFEAVTERAITYVVGDGTSTLSISLPKVEIMNITTGDQNGIMIYDIPFKCVRSSGDDEISLTFAAV